MYLFDSHHFDLIEDINCTNLFETICITLANVANPEESHGDKAGHDDNKMKIDGEDVSKPRLNILNRLAVEGLIAVVDSMSKRCRISSKFPMTPFSLVGAMPDDNLKPSPPDSGNSGILGNTLYINNESVQDSQEYSYDYCSLSSSSDIVTPAKRAIHTNARTNSDISDVDFEVLCKTGGHHTSLALRERKIRKRCVLNVCFSKY